MSKKKSKSAVGSKAYTLEEADKKFLNQRVGFKCKGTGRMLVGICRKVQERKGKVILIITDVPSRMTCTFKITLVSDNNIFVV